MQAADDSRAASALIGARAAPLHEVAIRFALAVCGILSIFITLAIILVLADETIGFFGKVSIGQFFGDTTWTPMTQRYGVWALIAGTLLTTGIAMLVALPLGIMAAIYLSEYAPAWARNWLKPSLEILAGVPTIVYGYFAAMFLTPILQKFVPNLAAFNALSPGIVMGIMIVPMISSLADDALCAVPRSLREGSYALGASRVPTIFRVVLPAASSGIAAATILAISRAVGETMIVAIAAGKIPQFTIDPREQVQTMTGFIKDMSTGDVPTGSLEYQTLFAVGAALFVMTFIMNVASHRLKRRFRSVGQ